MHGVSSTWKNAFASPSCRTHVQLRIGNVIYNEERIVRGSLQIYGGLYSTFGIGNCCARQIEFEILPQKTAIPRQAEIKVYVWLTAPGMKSERVQKGTFFISTRKLDRETGVLHIHGYDAMLKAEEVWLDSSYDAKTWPMPAATAVADIAQRMGVNVDDRTVLEDAFPVQYPVDGEGDMTMREVLGRIAVANAGNWIMSDDGQLLLVGLNSIPAQSG